MFDHGITPLLIFPVEEFYGPEWPDQRDAIAQADILLAEQQGRPAQYSKPWEVRGGLICCPNPRYGM